MTPPLEPEVFDPRPAAGLAAALLLAALLAGPASAALETRHVVIVSIDGGRWSETLGHPSLTWHPRIGGDLAAVGAQPARFENIGITNTNPGHSALMTGTLQPIANDGSERPHKPTLFEYLRQQKGTPQSDVRLVLRKPKLDVLAYSDHPSYGAAYGATVSMGYASDQAVYDAARSQILSYHPVVTLVHFGDPDILAHGGDWNGYVTALRLADSLTWQLWTAIQADPVMSGKTTIFVTNDHGRHDDAHGGFVNHGDGCDGCRRIEMVMAGPDSYAGLVSAGGHDQRAVARTAAHLLGVSMPLADGRVMDDLLLEPSAPYLDAPRQAGALTLEVFPNPSRAGAAVRIRGAIGADARLEVVDAAGRRVASAMPVTSTAGAREWWWNGLDDRGRGAPPGTYLVRAIDSNGKRAARVTLLR